MSYFLIYLIKSTVYLGLFYAFFLIAMRGTTFFRLNRWMLLLGTVVCMLLPCYTLTVEEVEGMQLPMQVLDEMLVLRTPEEALTTKQHICGSLALLPQHARAKDQSFAVAWINSISLVEPLCSASIQK